MTILDGIADGMDQVNHITYVTDVLRNHALEGHEKPSREEMMNDLEEHRCQFRHGTQPHCHVKAARHSD